jgi:hypothetical protein
MKKTCPGEVEEVRRADADTPMKSIVLKPIVLAKFNAHVVRLTH